MKLDGTRLELMMKSRSSPRRKVARAWARRFLAEVATYSGLTYAGVALAAVAGIVEARAFGAEGYGVLVVVVSLTPFLIIGLGLGLPVSVLRSVAVQPDEARTALGLALRQAVRSTAVAVPVAIGASAYLLSESSMSVRVAAAAALSLAPIGVFSEAGAQVLMATRQVTRLGLFRFIPVAAVAGVVLVAWSVGGLTVELAVVGLAAKPLTEVCLIAKFIGRPQFTRAPLRPHLRFGLKALPSQIASLGTMRIDQVILLPLLGSAEVGRYAVCVTLAGLPITITQALIARRVADITRAGLGGNARIGAWVMSNVGKTALVSVALFGVSAAALPLAYGDGFRGLTLVLLVLTFATIIVSGVHTAGAALVALGRPLTTTFSWGIGLVVSIALLPKAASVGGVLGAAWLSCVAYALTFAAMAFALRRASRDAISGSSAHGRPPVRLDS